MRRQLAALLTTGLVATASGCSFVAVRRPPRVATDAPLRCTESRAAPALDTAGAVITTLSGLMVWGLCTFTATIQGPSDPSRPNCDVLLWATVLPTAAYTGAAVYGFRATGECRRLMTERRALPPVSGPPGGQPAGDPAGPGAPRISPRP